MEQSPQSGIVSNKGTPGFTFTPDIHQEPAGPQSPEPKSESKGHSRTSSNLQAQVQAEFENLGNVQSPRLRDVSAKSPKVSLVQPNTVPKSTSVSRTGSKNSVVASVLEDVEMPDVVESEETIRKRQLSKVEEMLVNMENTRLELIPLLFEITEQVKNRSIAVKDVSTACGPVRVRLTRLHEWRKEVESILQTLQMDQDPHMNGSSDLDIQSRICMKINGIQSFIEKVENHQNN